MYSNIEEIMTDSDKNKNDVGQNIIGPNNLKAPIADLKRGSTSSDESGRIIKNVIIE